MRQVTIYTTDKDYGNFIELAKSLRYVKRIKTDEEPYGNELIESIKAGLEEVKLYEQGKLKTTPAEEFLDEI